MKSDPANTNREGALQSAAEEIRRLIVDGATGAIELVRAEVPELFEDIEQAMDLVYAEIDEREQLGESPNVKEYTARFPEWASRLRRLVQVHLALRDEDVTSPDADHPTVLAGQTVTGELPAGFGRRIGQYRLIRAIGRGATGVVFEAEQVSLKRLVAVKVLRQFGTDEARERFLAEAELTARLRHPNIIQVYEVGHDGGSDFLSMELLEGGSLAQTAGTAARTPLEAAKLVQTLANAIANAHEEGVVHRDLKPGNVLIGSDGSLRISDFGLARYLNDPSERKTQTGAILGTPGYMAPEQASGSTDVGPAADVYALGAILYELLTGRPPYHGTSIFEIIAQMRVVDPAPVRQLRPGVPRDLETICMKCLERSAGQRYTGAELGEELNRFLGGHPIVARRVGIVGKAFRWAVRHRAVAGLAALSVLILIVGIVGVTSQWLRAEEGLERAKAATAKANAATTTAKAAERKEQQQRLVSEDRLYRQQILAAGRELQAGAADVCKKLLAECAPSLRGWEWDYLAYQVRSADAGFAGITPTIYALDVSSDGRFVAAKRGPYTEQGNRRTIVWHTATRKVAWTYDKPRQGLSQAFSPDGSLLLIAGGGDATLHETATGRIVKRFDVKGSSHWGAAFSSDGKRVAYPSGSTYRICSIDPDDDSVVVCDATSECRGVYAASFHPTRNLLAVATRVSGIKVFDSCSGQLLQSLECGTDNRYVEFSPSGQLLVASGYWRKDQGCLRVWEPGESGFEALATRYDRSGARTGFRFTPDGQYIAVTSGTSPVRLMDPRDLHEHAAYPAHEYTRAVAFMPNSRVMLTAGVNSLVRVWDRRREERRVFGRQDSAHVTDFAMHPNRLVIALACDRNPARGHSSFTNTVEEFDFDRWQRPRIYRGHRAAVRCCSYDPSGQFLVTGSEDSSVRVWDAETSKLVRTISTHAEPVVGVHCAADGDGPRVVSVDEAGEVAVHRLSDGTVADVRQSKRPGVTHSELFCNRVFLASDSGEVEILSLGSSHSEAFQASDEALRCLAVDGESDRLCTTGDDGVIRLWSLAGNASPELIWENREHSGTVFSVAFHPGGRRLVSAGGDGYIRILHAKTGVVLLALKMPPFPGSAYRARFCPKTDRLLAATLPLIYSWEVQPPDSLGDDPLSPEPDPEITANWHRLTALRCEQTEHWFGAVKHWRAAGEFESDDASIHAREAQCQVRLENWSAAEAAMRQAIVIAEANEDRAGYKSLKIRLWARLGRLLATCPDDSIRSPQDGLVLATKAFKQKPLSREVATAFALAVAAAGQAANSKPASVSK